MNFKSLRRGLLHGLVVMNFAGVPYVQLKEQKSTPALKNNLSLKSDTYFRTNANDYIVLKLNDQYQVTLLPDSVLTVDGVRHRDEFRIRSIFLRRGQVHIQDVQASGKMTLAHGTSADPTETDTFNPLKIESDYFSFPTVKNQKYSLLVDMNLKDATLKVCNAGSDFNLELFDHEVDQLLKTNEGVKFKGVLDKTGQLAFDQLLEKRKIPKGEWLAKEPCAMDQVKKIQDQVVQFHVKNVRDKEKARLQKMADKKRNDGLYLCHEPYGKLDQCHFILRQKKCVRERCNAEGKWADQMEIGVGKNLCGPQGQVKDCGY